MKSEEVFRAGNREQGVVNGELGIVNREQGVVNGELGVRKKQT